MPITGKYTAVNPYIRRVPGFRSLACGFAFCIYTAPRFCIVHLHWYFWLARAPVPSSILCCIGVSILGPRVFLLACSLTFMI